MNGSHQHRALVFFRTSISDCSGLLPETACFCQRLVCHCPRQQSLLRIVLERNVGGKDTASTYVLRPRFDRWVLIWKQELTEGCGDESGGQETSWGIGSEVAGQRTKLGDQERG